MPRHNITRADDVRIGAAISANRRVRGAPVNSIVIESFAPALADADGISASQAVAAATVTGALINGALASGGAVVFDVPRNVVAAWTNSAVVTVTGTDQYGAPLVEQSASGVALTGVKAFKTVTKITVSADVTGFTAGSGAKLGLSFRPKVGGFIRGRLNEDSADAGTYVAPIRTTSTATTVDVRGTYAYAGTANGTNVFTVMYAVDNGPSDSDLFGIPQFAG
jgi:hypothetical protein